MKKLLSLLMFAAALLVPWATRAQSSATLPYSTGFEATDDNSSWTILNGSQSNKWYVGTAAHNTGSQGLYISSDNGTTNNQNASSTSTVFAVRTLNFAQAGQYLVSFDWRCAGESTYDYLRCFLVPTSVTLTAGTLPTSVSATGTPSGWIDLGGKMNLGGATQWHNVMEFVNITTTGDMNLVFLWRNDGSVANQPPAAVDNLWVGQSTCPVPTNIVASVAPTGLDFSWTAGGTESEWMVSFNGGAWTSVSSTTASYTGLTPNTDYTFRVRAVCGTGDTSFAVTTTVRTPCSYLGHLPYVQDFEAATAGGQTSTTWVECMTRLNNGTTYFGWPYVAGSTYNHTTGGSKGLYWYNTTTASTYGDYQIVVLPGVDPDSFAVNTLQLSFWARPSSASYSPQFQVGVMTNPMDASTFQQVSTVSVLPSTDWQFFEVPLSGYTGSGAYVALRATRPVSSWYAYVDDLTLESQPSCPRPSNLVFDTVGTDMITLSWTDNTLSSYNEYVVEYRPSGDTIWQSTSAYDTTADLQYLDANTLYEVRVYAVCGTSDTSGIIEGTVRTACEVLGNLPYAMTFEGEATGSNTSVNFVPCLTRLNNGTTNFGWPYVGGSAYNHAPGGSRGLYWFNSTTATTYGDYQIVVLPGVDTDIYPISNLQLRFWARPSTTSYSPQFQVGVMADPTDAATFQQVGTVSVMNTTEWQEFTVQLGSFTGSGQHVAIRALRPTSSWYAYVDDIVLEEIPTCPPLTGLTATTTASNAVLNWGYMSGYDIPAGYEVTYFPANDATNTTSTTSSDPYVVLTGLTSGITYKAYVRADCGGGDYGRIDSITFTPQVVGFSQIGSGTSTSMQVPLNNDYYNSYSQQLVLASELSGPCTLTGIDFNYAGTDNMYEKYDVEIYMANVTQSSLSSSAVPYNASTFRLVYSGELNCIDSWEHFQFDTPFSYDGTSNLLIVVVDNSDSYDGGDNYFYVHSGTSRVAADDNNYFSISSTPTTSTLGYRANMRLHYTGAGTGCVAPVLVAGQVGSDEVTLVWAPGNDETAWDVDYRTVGASTWTNVASSITTTDYTITGLNPATNYEFRVSHICGTTTYTSTLQVVTLCVPAALPYSENFDSITTSTSTSNYGLMPNCWDYTLTGTSSYQTGSYLPYVYYNASYSNSGNYCLRLGGVGYFVLPEMAAAIDSLLLTFNAYKTTSTYGLIVGVMENGQFVPVDTVNLAVSQHTPVEVSFANYSGGGDRIAFRNTNTSATTYYSYIYIDDITVDYIPDCPRVGGVVARNITSDGATIAWTPNSSATGYIVEYGEHGFEHDAGTTVTAYVDSIDLTGLTSNTLYDVYVREDCTSAAWSFRYSFRTECATISSMPYIEDFENEPYYLSGSVTYAQAFHSCWTRINDATGTYNYYPYLSTSASYVHSGSVGMYWYHSTTSTYANNMYAVLPPVDLNVYSISNLTLAFYAKTTSSSYHPQPIIGVMSDPTDTSTFTPVYTFTATEITTEWTLFSKSLASYTGSGAYIAIKWPRPTSTSYMGIDDIYLTDDWCDAPTNVAASSTDETVTVSWAAGNGTSFTVVLGDDTISNVTDTSYTFTNLTPNTAYTFSVAIECTTTNSMFTTGSIRTQCVALDSLPYVQDFEGATTGTSTSRDFVNCLGRLNNGTTYFGYPYVGGSTYNHTTGGSKGLYWFNSITAGTYGDYQIVVLPAVDTDTYPISTLQLKFWARPSSTSYSPQFQVGVMTDPSDPATFQQVGTASVSASTTWQEFITMFGNFTGSGAYVAIRAMRPTSSWYAYLDDIELSVAPQCPPVVSHRVTTTVSAARISWTADPRFGYEPDSYSVSYGYASDNLVGATTVTTSVPELKLTGLDPDTAYIVSIVPICTEGYSPAYTFNFNTGVLPCGEWDTTSGAGSGPIDTIVVGIPSNGTTTPSEVMPVNNGYNYSYCQHLILASEIPHTGPLTISGIAFEYAYTQPMTHATTCSLYVANTTRANMSNSDSTFVPYNQLQLVYIGPLNCTTNGWNSFAFNQGSFQYDGTSNVVVAIVNNSGSCDGSAYVFRYENTNGGTVNTPMTHRVYNNTTPYGPTQMDAARAGQSYWRSNMKFITGGGSTCLALATCSSPSLRAMENEDGDLDLDWLPGYQETSWDLDYRVADSTTWTPLLTNTSLMEYTVSASSLQPNTEYEFRVTANCTDSNMSATVHYTSPCAPYDVPFFEDFENFSSTLADPLPNCWVKHTNQTSNYPYASTSQHHSGSKSMYMYSTSTTYSYMVLPLMNLPIDSTMVSFWMYKASAAYSLYVGVMTDPEDYSTFTAVDTVSPTVNSTWEPIEVSLASYTGTGRYIAIMSPNGITSYPYIDDLGVDRISNCPRVGNVYAANITSSSATIHWDTTSATDYEVEVGLRGFTPGTGAGTLQPASMVDSLSFSTLGSNTAYDVYVRGICGSDTSNWSFVVTFRTACGLVNVLPLVEDFETASTTSSSSAANFLTCWTHINNGTSYSGYPYISSSSTYNHTAGGTKGLYWYASTTATTYGDYMYVVLPPVDTVLYPVNGLMLSFWAKSSSASYNPVFEVGVMTSNTDTAFEVLRTFQLRGNTEWEKYEALLTNHTGYGNYIAIRALRPTSAWYAYMDDISLDVLPSCPRVDSLRVTSALSDEVSLAWVRGGSEASWQVSYGAFDTIVADTAVTITGLIPQTTYTFSVRPVCGVGDTGNYRNITATTTCAAVSLPYTENFDNLTTSTTAATGVRVGCWDYVTTGSATYQTGSYVPQVYYSSTYAHSGSYSLRLYGVGYHSLPPMPTSLDSLQLTFWEYCTSANYGLQVGVMEGSTFIPVQTLAIPTSTHVEYTVYFSSYTGTSRTIAFRNTNTSATTYYSYHYIDNIEVDYVPSCVQVQDVEVTATATSSVTLDWLDVTPAPSYIVEYGQPGFTRGTGTTQTVTTHPAVISGLAGATAYDFYVKAVCAPGDTAEASEVITTSTECVALTLPYVQNFDAVTGTTYGTAGLLPPCWEGYSNGTSAVYVPHVIASGSYHYYASAPNSLVMTSGSASYGDTHVVKLPLFSQPVNTLEMSFWMSTESSSNGHLLVGYLTGPDIATDFVVVDSIHASSSTVNSGTPGYYIDTVSFANAPATAQRIAFLWYYNASCYTCCIDNVEVRTSSPACPAPSLTITNLTNDAATINVSGTGTLYELAYGTTASSLGTPQTNATGVFNLSGLQGNTEYYYSVRQQCSSGSWSVAVTGSFTTTDVPCTAPTDLVVSNATYSGATLTWTPGNRQTRWEVHLTGNAVDRTDTVETTPTFTYTDLVEGSSYTVAVRALCGTVEQSPWSDAVTLTTLSCDQVTGVSVSAVTSSSATLTWPATGAASYTVEYGYQGMSQGDGTTTTVSTNRCTLDGLEANTRYDVYVRGNCTETVSGIWSTLVSFTTTEGEGILGADGEALVVYPNPASELVTIETPAGSIVTLVDLNGRHVGSWNAADGKLTVDVSELAKGTYFVRVATAEGIAVRKLIVK